MGKGHWDLDAVLRDANQIVERLPNSGNLMTEDVERGVKFLAGWVQILITEYRGLQMTSQITADRLKQLDAIARKCNEHLIDADSTRALTVLESELAEMLRHLK